MKSTRHVRRRTRSSRLNRLEADIMMTQGDWIGREKIQHKWSVEIGRRDEDLKEGM